MARFSFEDMPSLPPRFSFRPAPKRDHKAEDRARGTRHARGYDTRWGKLRDHILATEPLCRPCKVQGRTTAARAVDHIVPKAQGGTDDQGNLQPICTACHATKTAHERRGYRTAG